MSEATLDGLSLTLPDWRAAIKRRVKRPRKPTEGVVLGLAFWGAGLVWNVLDLAGGGKSGAVSDAMCAFGCAVELQMLARCWRRGLGYRAKFLMPEARPIAAFWLACLPVVLLGL